MVGDPVIETFMKTQLHNSQ